MLTTIQLVSLHLMTNKSAQHW